MNELIYGFILGLVCVGWLFTVKILTNQVIRYFDLKRRRREFPYVEENTNNKCKLHDWYSMTLVLGEVVGKHLVCTKCGVISGTEKRLNKPALQTSLVQRDRIEKTKQIREVLSQELKQRFNQKIEDYIASLKNLNIDDRSLLYIKKAMLNAEPIIRKIETELYDETEQPHSKLRKLVEEKNLV